MADGSLDLARIPWAGREAIRTEGKELAETGLGLIERNRREREERIRRLGEGKQPYLYVIVATGDIYEDVVQAKAAAPAGGGHHRRDPQHGAESAGLRPLRSDPGRVRRDLRHPGEFPDHAPGPG